MPPDLISASVNWKVPQNRPLKTPQDAFSVGVRYHALPGKRNETWDCAVYAFAALEDCAGFSKPNDMLERLAKELLSDDPKWKPRWGTQEKPNLQFQTAPAPHEGWVPPWRKNAQRRNAWTGR
jgi:phage terminase large subunit GpA-like protein